MTETHPPAGAPSASNDDVERDHVLRAITTPDNFRLMVAITTLTVRQALRAQQTEQQTAHHFADLLTGTVLVRETMSPAHRVQAVLKGGEGQGSLVADAHPDGMTRGLVQLEGDTSFAIGHGSTLLMMRGMARGVHRSLVQPAADATVPVALMTYLQESEQIVSMLDTAQVWRDGELLVAGGYLLQVLPNVDRAALAVMAQRLEDFPPLSELLTQLPAAGTRQRAHALLDEILYGIAYTQLDDTPIHFGCRCSDKVVMASLATLGRDDIAEIVRDQRVVDMSCDYCGRTFQFSSAQLEGLLRTS